MPKRPNPYLEDLVPQSKTHVCIRQFNNNEYRIQKVYEKTLDLLFKGAKKSHELRLTYPDTIPIEKKDGMKQLFIGKDGLLLHSGNVAVEKSSAQQCKCNGIKSGCCSYCEIPLCTNCLYQCGLCQMPFCSKCSLIGPEGGHICVSCYR